MVKINNVIRILFKKDSFLVIDRNLTQWDKGQKLEISGLDVTENVQVHFSLSDNRGSAKVLESVVSDGVLQVNIPAFILENESARGNYYDAYAWIYISDAESGETVKEIIFTIKTRPKPGDYISDQEDVKTWEKHNMRLEELENAIEELKRLIQYGDTTPSVAILDNAILDLATLG